MGIDIFDFGGLDIFGGLMSTNLLPSADDTYDIGSSTSQWKDSYIDGTAYIDSLVVEVGETANEDIPVSFGNAIGGIADLILEAADANAKALVLALPNGGATYVPAFIIGDRSVYNVDLGWFNGLTEPSIVVVNDAKDAYIRIDAGDDAVAGSQGIYFKAAADEDIELINLSVTGTPRIFWDESEDQFSTAKLAVTTSIKIGGTSGATFDLQSGVIVNSLPFRTTALWVGDTASLGVVTSGYFSMSTGNGVATKNTDDTSFWFAARDNTVGVVTIGGLRGAADPFWLFGRDDTGVATNAVTDGITLRMGAGTNNEAAGQGFGISVMIGNAASQLEERGSWDTVLVTATDGSEDARFDWNLMSAGAMNYAMTLAATGVLSVDLGGSGSAAQVDLFDDYDDALVLRQGIQQRNRELLADIGVLEREPRAKSGYLLKVQPMLSLLAGGIYQTRDYVESLEKRVDALETELTLRRNQWLQ